MKLWIDDIRKAPVGYERVHSVSAAIAFVQWIEGTEEVLELIDIDHDAGFYACDGGDYIKFLDWLEETGRSYPIRIHSMNPVGVENMRRIIQRNGWTEVH